MSEETLETLEVRLVTDESVFSAALDRADRRVAAFPQSVARGGALAAQRARESAQRMADAMEQQFRTDVARIKEGQARGFITPAEARKAGREAAHAYNQAVLQALDQAQRTPGAFAGRAGREAFTQIAGSLKAVETASRSASTGVGQLRLTLASMAAQAAGANVVVGRLATVVSGFALGGAVSLGVLGGLAAIAFGWQKLTSATRENRKATEEAVEQHLRLARMRASQGTADQEQENERLAQAEARARRRLSQEQARLAAARRLLGAATDAEERDRIEASVRASEARVATLQKEQDDAATALQEGQQRLSDIRAQNARRASSEEASALAALISSNRASIAETRRAREIIEQERARLASATDLGERAEATQRIQQLTGAFDAAGRAAGRTARDYDTYVAALTSAVRAGIATRDQQRELIQIQQQLRSVIAAETTAIEDRVRALQQEMGIREALIEQRRREALRPRLAPTGLPGAATRGVLVGGESGVVLSTRVVEPIVRAIERIAPDLRNALLRDTGARTWERLGAEGRLFGRDSRAGMFEDRVQLGPAASEVMGMIQGAAAGMGPFAILLPVVNGALEALEPVLATLIEPLRIVGQLLGNVLAPVLEVVAIPLKALAVVVTYVVQGLGWMVSALGKFINAIIPFGSPARRLVEWGENMQREARAARKAIGEVGKAAEDLEKVTASLRNAPLRWSVDLARFRVATGGDRRAAQRGGDVNVQSGAITIVQRPGESQADLARRVLDGLKTLAAGGEPRARRLALQAQPA